MDFKFKRSRNSVFAGVAAGIAEKQKMLPRQIRAMWVLAFLISGGYAFIAYVILAFVAPLDEGFDINDYRDY